MSELRRRMLAGEELLGDVPRPRLRAGGRDHRGRRLRLARGRPRARRRRREATLAQLQAAARAGDRARAARRPARRSAGCSTTAPRACSSRACRASATPRARSLATPLRRRARPRPGLRARAPSGATRRYAERADDERVAMVQIETRGALDAAAEIAALPGVDALFVGPYDLGVALGVTPGAATPEVQEAARTRRGLPRARGGKAAAVFLGDPGARAALSRARLHAHQRGLHEHACWPARPTRSGGHCDRDAAARPRSACPRRSPRPASCS